MIEPLDFPIRFVPCCSKVFAVGILLRQDIPLVTVKASAIYVASRIPPFSAIYICAFRVFDITKTHNTSI